LLTSARLNYYRQPFYTKIFAFCRKLPVYLLPLFHPKSPGMFGIIQRLLFLCLCLSGATWLQAQQATASVAKSDVIKSKWLTFGAGWAYQTTHDEGMSPLRYQGHLVSSHLGYEEWTQRKIERWNLVFNYGLTRPDPVTNQNQVFGGWFDYTYLRKMRAIGDGYGNWYLGGAFSSTGNVRYNSNLVNTDLFHDAFFSLNLASSVDYQLELGKHSILLYYEASIPVISYGFRPTYSGLYNVVPPDEDYVGEVLASSGFGSWNTYFGLKSLAEISYLMRNGNQLKLRYYWNFYLANLEPHRVTNADQIVQFVLAFEL